MRMRIFTNEQLNEDELDYSRWETINGDYINISMVGTTYLERCLDLLAQFVEKYPKHRNIAIWLRYMNCLEDELLSRDGELVGT